MIKVVKPKILSIHLTGTGGYGERLPIDGKPDKYISHVAIRIQREILPEIGNEHMYVGKGGLWVAPERKARKFLERNLGPNDLVCFVGHSWGVRDWFQRVQRRLLASGHLVTGRNWVGVVSADMEWGAGLFRDNKEYHAPPVDWGYNLYQPDGLGGTYIHWMLSGGKVVGRNTKVNATHRYIDTSDEVKKAIHALYTAAKLELAKRTKAATDERPAIVQSGMEGGRSEKRWDSDDKD